MPPRGSILGSVVSLPLLGLLAILFFTPWLNLTCTGQVIGKASGWDLTVGDMSLRVPGPRAGQGNDPTKDIHARPWFALGLILPIVLLVVSAKSAAGHISAVGAGKALIVLGVAGLGLMFAATNISYSDDLQAKMKSQGAFAPASPGAAPGMDAAAEQMGREMMDDALKTEATTGLWLSLVLYAFVVLCGLANVFLASSVRAPAYASEITPMVHERRSPGLGIPAGPTIHTPRPETQDEINRPSRGEGAGIS